MQENLIKSLDNDLHYFLEKLENVTQDDELFDTMWHIGHIHLMMENYHEAFNIFSDLLNLYPKNWEILYNLGISLLNLHETQRALTYFTIINEEYHEQCDVSEIISELRDEELYSTETHRYFISCTSC